MQQLVLHRELRFPAHVHVNTVVLRVHARRLPLTLARNLLPLVELLHAIADVLRRAQLVEWYQVAIRHYRQHIADEVLLQFDVLAHGDRLEREIVAVQAQKLQQKLALATVQNHGKPVIMEHLKLVSLLVQRANVGWMLRIQVRIRRLHGLARPEDVHQDVDHLHVCEVVLRVADAQRVLAPEDTEAVRAILHVHVGRRELQSEPHRAQDCNPLTHELELTPLPEVEIVNVDV